MKIFNDKVAVALFDNDKDVEDAVQELHDRSFGAEQEDEIQIIDQARLSVETPSKGPVADVADIPRRGTSGAAGRTAVGVAGSSEPQQIEVNVSNTLVDLGIGREEADFFGRHVARGSAVVVVDTTEERAQEALEIMKKHNARGEVT